MGRQSSPLRVDIAQLRKFWPAYTEWQSGQLAISTIAKDYAMFWRRIEKIPPTLKRSPQVIEWLRENYAPETCRRTIQQLSACYDWAIADGRTKVNPWASLPKIKAVRGADRYRSFTDSDRKAIVGEFYSKHPDLAPWVDFLFCSGCRPSEAAGLRWKNVAVDCSALRIEEAYLCETQSSQGTKTHTEREFACGSRLSRLLRRIRPKNPNPESRVFLGAQGGSFHYVNFQTRYWKPLVQHLVEEGRVSCYLSQKNCRHTKATQLLREGMDVKKASSLLGNHPNVFLNSYADRSRDLKMSD
jgi:integrase